MKPYIYILSHEMKFSTNGKSLLLSTCFFIIIILTTSISVSQFGVETSATSVAILWVALALSALLSVKVMFQIDFDDGTLDWLMLSPISLETIIVLKAITHWLTTCLPMMVLTPLVCIPLGITFDSALWILLVMLIGTPAISFISTIGAALTLGERGSHLLLSIFILPTFLPILLFGIKISMLVTNSIYDSSAFLILLAISLVCIAITPFITSMIIKVHYT
ncbi:MAG: heme exporter protein CcmB [Paracoccaceae bacterium]|jgi:heme exporter protein B|nr:heme exporter protein CcmB [Paracoccaceae bacterium]